MIDEDLYQQAADELNTDKRRLHIWAKACALASDDHDEARYLYTNLRVEEMIAEREQSGDSSATSPSTPTRTFADNTLALEPLDLDESLSQSSSTTPEQDQAEQPVFDELAVNAGVSNKFSDVEIAQSRRFEDNFDTKSAELSTDERQARDESDSSVDFLDDTIDLTSDLDGTAVFEPGKADAADTLPPTSSDDSTLKSISADEELEALLGGVYEAGAPVDTSYDDDNDLALTADFSELIDTQSVLDNDTTWLEKGVGEEDDEIPEPPPLEGQLQTVTSKADFSDLALPQDNLQESDRLEQEMERQARELPGQPSDVVAVNEQTLNDDINDDIDDSFLTDSDSEPFESESTRLSDTSKLDSIFDSIEKITKAAASRPSIEPQTEPEESSRSSDIAIPPAAAMSAAPVAVEEQKKPDIPARTAAVERPLDLSEEHSSGAQYSIMRRNTQTQAVKQGVSWSALFMTLPFLLYRHLFGTAVVYTLMWLILIGGLLVSGLAWLDAGPAASIIIKASTAGFALLSVIGLLYLPFRYANQWRESKLEQRGFEQIALVRDRSPSKAISQLKSTR